MKTKSLHRLARSFSRGFALALISLLAAHSVQALTLYWDATSPIETSGFGTAGGIWGTDAFWTTSTTGETTPGASLTATTDALYFGNGADGLLAGSITVGTVDAGDMTFASGSGSIVLSGGTITLAAVDTITVDNADDTISSVLAGAATSLTKAGTGTLILSGANTYTGATIINAGTLKLGATGDGTNTPLGTTAAGTSVTATGAALDLGGFTLGAAEALSLTGAGTSATTGALTNSGAAVNYSGAVTIAAAGTTIGGTGDITLTSALVTNANSFTKVGAGKLTLSVNSTRTGATQIDGGTLRINDATAFGTAATTITINAGTLEVATANTIATGGGITLNNGGTLLNGLAGGAVRIDKTINVQNSATAVVSFDSGTNASNVLTINGGGNTRLAGGATGAKIQIKGSGAVDVGDGNNTRTTGVIGDWYLQGGQLRVRADSELGNAANKLYFQGGTLYMGNAAFTLGASRVLDFSNASGGTIDTTGSNLTLGTAGQLSGANKLTKTGTSTLILSAANAGFSGEVNITGGSVRANDGTGINSGSLLTLNGGVFETGANLARTGGSSAGNMQITGGASGFSANGAAVQVAFGSLVSPTALTWGSAPFAPTTLILNASTANNTLEFKNAVDLGASARTVQVDANVATLSGILTGTGGGLIKTGTGALVLSGVNSYTGTTTLNGGILNAGVAENAGVSGPFGVPATAAGSIIFNGGTLQYSAANAVDYSGRFTTTANNAYSIDTNNRAVTFGTALGVSGTSGLTKLGSGTLTLSAANTYAGATTVSAGTLQSGISSALPSGTNVILSGNAAGVTATLDLNGYSTTIGTLAFGGSTTTSGAAVTTGAETGMLTLGGDVTYANANNPLGATISGKLDLGSVTRTFTVNDSTTAASDMTVSANISGTDVGLTKAGTGVLLLSGTNSYTGVTTVNAGTLQVAKPASLYNDTGDMSTWTAANITVNSTGTLAVNYGGGTDFTQAQVGTMLTNLTTSINNNGLRAGSVFAFDTTNAAGGASYANAIVDSTGTAGFGAVGLTKLGANTLTLSGASTYTGATKVTTGILKAGIASVLNTSGAFGLNSAVTLPNTAGVAIDIAGYNTQIGSLAGGGTTGGNVTLGANTLTVGGLNTNTTFSGVISSSAGVTGVSLNKIGSGTLVINNGSNSFTGNIVIDGGRLEYNVPGNLGTVPSSFRSNNISILNGGSLYCNNGGDNGANLGTTRGIYLGPGTQYILTGNGDTKIGGVISGPGGLTKIAGNGTYQFLWLADYNTYTGDTRNNSGKQFNLDGAHSLQYSAFDTSGGGLGWNTGGGNGAIYLGGLVGGGNFGMPGAVNLYLQPQIVGLTKTYTGALSGSATQALILNGPGTQALNGANTYAGSTSINQGVLSINTIQNVGGAANSLGQPALAQATINIGNATTGATLVYTGTGNTTDRVINLAGTTGGATLDQSGASGVLTLGNITATIAGAKTLTLQGSTAGSAAIGGIIADSSAGATSLTKTGSGQWTLNGANTFSGDTTLNDGTLTIGNVLALQNSALNYTAGTLGFSDGINTPTLGGLKGSTSLSLASNVTALTLNPGTGVTHTYSGILGSDIVAMNLAKSGLGTQILGAANYTGNTAVDAGKLYLNGSNATTAISVAGLATLGGTGTATSAIATVADTGIIEAGSSGAGGLTLGGLTLSNTATVNIANIGNYSGSSAVDVSNSGGLIVNGAAGSVTLVLSGSAPASGTAHLIQYQGAIGGTGAGFAAFALDPAGLGAGPRAVFTLANPAGYVDVNYSLDKPVWSGAGSGNWITSADLITLEGTPTNWVLSSNALTQTNFIANDAALFNDAVGSGTTTVTISVANVTPASVTFDNSSAKSYTLQGAYGIIGGTSLTKSNDGTLTITNTNSYSGTTTISGGTLRVGNGGPAGTLGSGEVVNNATLEFDRFGLVTVDNAISGNGSIIQNGSGELVLSGPNNHSGTTTLNTGKLTLGSATALGGTSGTLIINGGTLDSSVASLVLTNDNAQTWNSNLLFAGTNDLNLGAGAISLGSTAGTRTVTVDANTLTVGGVISNGTATALHKAGLGTLVLGGVNLYSGGTTIDAGTLTVNDGATLGASTGTLSVNNPNTGSGTAVVVNLNGNVTTGSLSGAIATPSDGTNSATINLAAIKVLTVTQTTDGVYDGMIAGDGKLVKEGGSMLTLSGANSYTGGTQLNDGTLSISSLSNLGPSGTIKVNSGIFQYTGSDVVSSNRFSLNGGNVAFDITQSAASLTITQQYGSSTIIKMGLGTLALGGNVGWNQVNPGQLTLSVNEGTMVLGATATDAGFMAVVNAVSDVMTGATLKLATGVGSRQFDVRVVDNFAMSGGTFDINGNANNYERQISGSGTITNSSETSASLNIHPEGSNTFSGNIVDGTAAIGLQYAAANGYGTNPTAVWALSGNNTYSGATTVGGGTLRAGSATALSPNSAYTVNATLDLAGHNSQIAGLSGAGIVNTSAGAVTLTVNNDVATSNADYSFDGTLQDGGGTLSLTKTGSKTLTLNGLNKTYTGTTTVSQGTLKLAAAAANNIANSATIQLATDASLDVTDLTSSNLTLASSQTLTGSGSVVGGSVTVGAGTTLAPATGAGSLNLGGGLTITDGGIFKWENTTVNTAGSPSTDWGVANVTGTTTLSNTAGTGSKLKLMFTDALTSFSNSFWDTNQTWNIITGGLNSIASNVFDTSNISVFIDSLEQGLSNIISGEGAFSTAVVDNDLQLQWTANTSGSPDIKVVQGTEILNNGSKDFGTVVVGANAPLTFTISNIGNADLTGLAVTKSGTHADDFTVTQVSPAAPVTGPTGTTTFTVTFSPLATGARSAAIHIASNDPDENPFTINVSGDGTTAYDQWALSKDLTGLAGSTADPAFDADPDKDGIKNGLEWVLGGNPKQNDNPAVLPAVSRSGGSLVQTFTRVEASIPETALTIEYGSSLTSWPKSVTVGADTAPADANGVTVTVTVNTGTTPDGVVVTIPAAGNAVGGKLFARMKVVRLPVP